MAIIKCCVVGCTSTNKTHRLFNLPKDDKLRALWMSFLVPVNSELLGLSKDQLVNKRVCQKHFDKYQLDYKGDRLKYGYPCLFSTKEIELGMPLSGDHLYDHNYSKKEDIEEVAENPVVVPEHPVDHLYSTPATNPPASPFLDTDFTTFDEFESSENPSTSECEQSSHNIQIGSLGSQDLTTFNVIESSEIPLTSECEQSSHNIQIGSLTSQDLTTFEVFESSEMPSTSKCEQSTHNIQIGSLGSRGQGILIRPHTQNSEEYIGFDVLVPRKNKGTTILVL